jgi:hypothetical protein
LQIFADGLFHGAMYVVAAAGLWLLWRARRELAAARAGRILFGDVLIGFGAWHVLDGVVSHWLLGIHRIRMDSSNPLAWDLAWFFAFGVAPLLIGWLLRSTGNGPARGRVAAAVVATAVSSAAATPMLMPSNSTQVIVYFVPGTTMQEVVLAAAAVDARLVGSDTSGLLWALDLAQPGQSRNLYRYGALLVSNSIFPARCFS